VAAHRRRLSLADEEVEVLEREVFASPAEFAHGLRNAFPEGLSGGPLMFRVDDGAAGMEIRLTPGPDRVIALLRLPTLTARIRFTAGDAEARNRMLRRMDMAMQRGGG
jgi:hypothetical protein